MRVWAGLVVAAVMGGHGAEAQRSAVSADLSPDKAADVFTQTVLDVCVPAVAGNGVSSLAAAREGRVQPTQDAATRRQAGASITDIVWDVASARGVVTVRESTGQCVVSVYGPLVAQTLGSLREAATARNMSARSMSDGATLGIVGNLNGKSVAVTASGNDPGAPGHQSKFSVVTAAVSLER